MMTYEIVKATYEALNKLRPYEFIESAWLKDNTVCIVSGKKLYVCKDFTIPEGGIKFINLPEVGQGPLKIELDYINNDEYWFTLSGDLIFHI